MLRAFSTQIPSLALCAGLVLSSASAFAASYPDFTGLVEQMSPSVVSIQAVQKRDNSPQQRLPQLPPPWDQIFGAPRGGLPQDDRYVPPPQSMGSGFITSDDGYVLTNSHVVHNAEEITVSLRDGKEYKAKLVGEDPDTDVALLKLDAKGFAPVKTGKVETLKVGSWVVAVGAPFGFEHSVSAGIVSAKGRSVGANQQYVPFIQTDVAINPGNSGGPLVNMDGEVVGINSQILSRTGGYMGISFAIPIDLAMEVAEQLKKDGKVKRGYLGVTYQDVSNDIAESFGLASIKGALVNSVEPGSPAAKAGLQVGDVVLNFNGKPIQRSADLPFLVGRTQPGANASLEILRNGKPKTLNLTVGVRGGDSDDAKEGPGAQGKNGAPRLGLAVTEIPPQLRELANTDGVFVADISDGPAARAGIRQGDIILSIDQKPVTSVADFKAIAQGLKAGRSVPVLVTRGQAGRQFLVMQLPK